MRCGATLYVPVSNETSNVTQHYLERSKVFVAVRQRAGHGLPNRGRGDEGNCGTRRWKRTM